MKPPSFLRKAGRAYGRTFGSLKFFPIFAIFLFIVEIFSPLAFAAERSGVRIIAPYSVNQGETITVTFVNASTGEALIDKTITVTFPSGILRSFRTDSLGQISFLTTEAGSYSYTSSDYEIQTPPSTSVSTEPTTNPVVISPPGSVSGSCFTSEMDAAEVNRYFSGMQSFQTEQLSQMSNERLMRNDPTNTSQQNIQINVVNGETYPIRDVSNLLGYNDKDREALAKDFGVSPDYGRLTLDQMRVVAARHPDKGDAISSLLGISGGKGALQPNVYDDYMVRMPNGKPVALSNLFNITAQDKVGNCLLDRTSIQGKITIAAELDRDLAVGIDESKTALKMQQHLTSSDTTASLNLQDGKAVVIPHVFETYVNMIGQYSSIDMFVTVLGAASAAFRLNGPEGVKKQIENQNARLDTIKKAGPTSFSAGVSYNLGPTTADDVNKFVWSKYLSVLQKGDIGTKIEGNVMMDILGKNIWKDSGLSKFEINTLAKGELQLADSVAGDSQVQALVRSRMNTLANDPLFASLSGTPSALEQAALRSLDQTKKGVKDLLAVDANGAATGLSPLGKNVLEDSPKTAEEQIKALADKLGFSEADKNSLSGMTVTDELNRLRKEEDQLDFQIAARSSKANLVFVYGVAWLLSARFALGAANTIFMHTGYTGDAKYKDSYLQIYVNNDKFASNFRKNTDFLGTGGIVDFASDMLGEGVPTKTFKAGNIYFVNKDSSDDGQESLSTTSLKGSGATGWQLSMGWKGKSESAMFENIKNEKDYTSFGIYSSNMDMGWTLERKQLSEQYYNSLLLVAPLLNMLILKKADPGILGTSLSSLLRLQAYNFIINDLIKKDRLSEDTTCDEATAKRYANLYLALVVVSQTQKGSLGADWYGKSFMEAFGNYLKSKKAFEGIVTKTQNLKLGNAILIVDPVMLARQAMASRGFEYVSTCKDTSYKILAYQQLGGIGASAGGITKKLDPINKLTKDLKLGDILGGVGNQVDAANLKELLNMRTYFENEQGMLLPSEVYYLNLDGANQQWFGVYHALQQKGCFRNCQDSKDGFVCNDEKGVTYTDKKTGKSYQLSSNPDRGLLSMPFQNLARTIIPNKIISASLSCNDNEMMKILPGANGGTLALSDISCGAMGCLKSQIEKVTGATVTDDLSASGFGKVLEVHTTQGVGYANGGKIRFIRNTGVKSSVLGIDTGTNVTKDGTESGILTKEESLVGTEVQSPSLEALEAGKSSSGSKVSILGNGQVKVTGYLTASEISSEEAGELETIITEKGRIDYDPVNQRLVAYIHTLAKNLAKDAIKDFGVAIKSNTDGNGKTLPAFGITNVIPKTGYEKEAQDMQKALDKVQTDANGNKGGFQVLETEGKRYSITTDDKGNPILSVFDKKTGETTSYPITGPLRQEGNNIIVPTDKGNFSFNLGMKDGQPTLSTTGPDGFKDIAALLAAKGMGGIIAFDPRTGLWYAMNGQDVPWNQDFAKKGLSYFNSADGTRGVAGDNMFSNPRVQNNNGGENNPLSMPSFPEDNAVAILMLSAILLGVVVIRVRKPEE